MTKPDESWSLPELLRLGPYMREGRQTMQTMEGAADAMDQLVEAAGYALDVLDHNRGKQARGRACERLRAAIAKITEYPPASPGGGLGTERATEKGE